MSCRAFSRRIEHQVLQQAFERTGAEQIQFEYRETAKNSPTGDFLKGLLGDIGAVGVLERAAFDEKCPALYHRVDYLERVVVGKN